jgi:hypothetical protein
MRFYNTLLSLKAGDRIVVPKSSIRMIQHHAIFLGFWDGRFWIIENKAGHGVRLVDSDTFFNGVTQITRIEKFSPRVNYDRNDLIRFALSKRGKKYDLVNYNCETFCNEIVHHKPVSAQANTGLGLFATVAAVAILAGLFGKK